MHHAYQVAKTGFTHFANHGEVMRVTAKQEASLKVLLVDDEMLVRSGTAMMLDELGHDVTEAVSGQKALQILADNPHFDVIITDYRMPDMDGMELISAARDYIPHMKAVLMTGYHADDPRFADLHAGSLSKPFGLEELEIALGGIC